MAEKRPFLIFFYLFLNFCKANKNCDYSANLKLFCNFLFYMGPYYVEFIFAFHTTLIRLEMTKKWPQIRGAGTPNKESLAQRAPRDRVKERTTGKNSKIFVNCSFIPNIKCACTYLRLLCPFKS